MRRAIILVPGFAKQQQLVARDRLVGSVQHYSDGWETALEDDKANDGQDVVFINAKGRAGEGDLHLGIYEAYWGDLIPDQSSESPWARVGRGTSLITYWMIGGLAKSIFCRAEKPGKLTVAMVFAGLILLVWYASTIFILLQAIANGLPENVATVTDLVGITGVIQNIATSSATWPIAIFVILFAGLGKVERIANVSAFTKQYLQDQPVTNDGIGLRAAAKRRVIAALDHVHSRQGDDAYDEVYIVAHSLGGAIAVDALAEYGDRLANSYFFTWGSALGTLVQQEPLIEEQIHKFYTATPQIASWIDVVFKQDFMGSKVPIPNAPKQPGQKKTRMQQVFPDTVEPTLPKGHWFFSSQVHDGYYACEEAVLMLVAPSDALPQAPKPKD